MRIATAVLLAALALAAPPARAAEAAAGPATRLVRLGPLEGLPADSTAAAAFQSGFDEAFTARELLLARGGPLANRFSITDDPRAEDAWSVQVTIGAPPPFSTSRRNPRTGKRERWTSPDLRASRGMTLGVFALSPEAIAAGARAMPERLAFTFSASAAPAKVVSATGVPGGFVYPWREAGRATARLVLELLHHRSGDLAEDAHLALAPAERAAVDR